MAMPEQYKYMRLQDAAISVGQKVNFYGVVSEYELPKATRGSDIICTMTVDDMSLSGPGLRVIFFSSTMDSLPQVKSIGDIIRFHRLMIKVHNGVAQAVGQIKLGSSFLLFHGKDGVGHTPYQSSSERHTMEDYDHQIIDLMRSWYRSQPISTGANGYLVPISGIKEGSYFDLCCKILAVDHQESSHVIILYVWDGTDASPCHLEVPKGNNNQDGAPEAKREAFPLLPREILSTFPPVGSALRVVPDIPIEELPLQLPVAGSWIKFRNLACRVHAGTYEAVFMHESKISLLSSTCELVKKCARKYEERVRDDDGCMLPQWAPKPLHSITVTDYEHVPFSTIREIICHPQVTFKFRCLVRVISILPSIVEDFCVLQSSFKSPDDRPASQQSNEIGENAKYMYRLQLTLEDATGRVHAYLVGEDAEHFFNGHPATNLQDYSATVGALQRKVDRLLGLEEYNPYGSAKSEARYNPPWIKCCLKSYYLQKENPWDTRRYRIFGTILL